ncbi:hypothetical protein PPEV_gp180 [Pseudomonas phage EL]|uniref:Uncharacterized protein n=1 Tax=Pseudomonas phage EL TaxID=273133 RepID=Q2Z0Q1_9CAUD|nr:hypothetical protein PPEV_gp180 [Pseudomonas phage EL]CAG27274.1 hypothetical protein [Pseudomonas phage EL]
MEENRKRPKASRLESISHKFVRDEELRDPPARLFRAILNKVVPTPHKWKNYLRDYLEYVVTTRDPQRAKTERITRQGNIKATYFQSYTLTFQKLLEGLSILRMKSCRIIIEVVDEHGEILTVEETIRIVEKKRLEKPIVDEPEE